MKLPAYGVHIFTALGAALGIWSLLSIFEGLYQQALWILLAAVLVDSVDGTLARKFDTAGQAPAIDGALMDNIVDYLTWTVAPLFWAYAVLNIPLWVLMICAVGSILAFSNVRAKTDDMFFLGFPSYWNIVVFYLFLLQLPVAFSSGILLVFAVGCVLPIKFIYPTRTHHFRDLTLILGLIYLLQMLLLLYLYEEAPQWLIYSSFIYPAYYFGFSFYLNLKNSETLPPRHP